MSVEYNRYLEQHRRNVICGLEWMFSNLPEMFIGRDYIELEKQFEEHDSSKYEKEEYEAYDAYFYGRNKSHKVVQDFNQAWLFHIHVNPHHWQHWVLIHDDPGDDSIEPLQMPWQYVIEMICDWWSFSWKTDNLYEIFDWWKEHEQHIRLHPKTRALVVDILDTMKSKLDDLSSWGLLSEGVNG